MRRILMLIKLKPDASRDAFEAWVRQTAFPSLRALPSVDDCQMYRANALIGSDGAVPYDYVEMIDTPDLDQFLEEADAVLRRLSDDLASHGGAIAVLTERVLEVQP